MKSNGKTVYYEVMRIAAIAFVLFNHLPGYALYLNSSGKRQILYMAVSMLTRFDVHLFMMVSGALLLSKDEDYSTVLKKRVSRFATVIVVFSACLYLLQYVIALVNNYGPELSFEHFIRRFLAGDIETSYWFLYAYLGFLLMLPLLQRIAKGLKKQDVIALIVIHMVFFTVIPVINLILKINSKEGLYVADFFAIPFATIKVIFYTLAGYFADRSVDIAKLKPKHIAYVVITAAAGIAVSCICTFIEGRATGTFTYNYVEMFEFVTTIAVFIFIKYIVTVSEGRKGFDRFAAVACFIGPLTFGIYLTDPFLKAVFYKRFDSFAEPILPTMVVSFIWVVISMIAGGAITFVLKKIPGIKKLL